MKDIPPGADPDLFQDFAVKITYVGLSSDLMQFPRDMYQNPPLLVRWQIYDNTGFHGNADRKVQDKINGFLDSARKTPKNLASSVGWPNSVFRRFLIQNT